MLDRFPRLSPITGDRIDGAFTVLGEVNTTWCRYVQLTGGQTADADRSLAAERIETCWLMRLLAITYAVARAAAVDGDAETLVELGELARMRRAA